MKWSANNLDNVPNLNTSIVDRSFRRGFQPESLSDSIREQKLDNEKGAKRKFPDSCVDSASVFNQQDSAVSTPASDVECSNTDSFFRPQRKQRKKRMLLHNLHDKPNGHQQLELGDFPDRSKHSNQRQTLREFLSLQLQKAMIADEDGDRAIHIAVAQENVPLVKKLCLLMKKAGISLDITNMLRQTPLHVAIIVGNCQIVRILLCHGASIHVKDRHGNNAVQLAVKFYETDTFAFIMESCKSSSHLNSVDYDGLTALHHAVFQRNCAAVDGLCQAGADVNAVDGKSGRTPLIHAVLSGYMDMVNLLLKYYACAEKSDYAGWSAVELAVQTGNRTMMRLFEMSGSITSASESGVMDWDDSSGSTVGKTSGNERTVTHSCKKKKKVNI